MTLIIFNNIVGSAEPREIPSYSKKSYNWKETGAMLTSSVAKWSASQSTGNIRHHLQMHRNTKIGSRSFHIQVK